MDWSHARFRLKIASGGKLLIDGFMALGPLITQINTALESVTFPPMDFSILGKYAGGQTLCYDITVNGQTLHIEISVLSDPGVAPEPVKHRHAA